MSTTPQVIGRFTARLINAPELCQLDSNGEIIAREQQTTFCAGIPIRCVADDKRIAISLSLYVEVDMQRLTGIDSDHRLRAVACAAATESIPRLAKYAPWQLYGLHIGGVSGTGLIPVSAEDYEIQQDEFLAESVVQQLTEATEFHRTIAAVFQSAKEYLESNLGYLRDEPSRARGAARFIAECMRSDATPNMGMWNREKASRLVAEVDDLIRRKNSNHSGYRRAADSIGTILYRVHPPEAWSNYPPPAGLFNTR